MIIDGGVLAGGLSRRFGNNDKALALYQGRPMVEHVVQQLQPHVNQVLLNTNGSPALFKNLDLQIIPDIRRGHPGPLAGIETILRASQADYVIVAPCDSPGLNARFAKGMIKELNKASVAPSIIGLTVKGKPFPLHICIKQNLFESVGQALDEGRYKVMDWLKQEQTKWVEIQQHNEQGLNINTPDQLL